MENQELTKTHKRLLGSLFFVLEQKIESIEKMITHPSINASYIIEQDLSQSGAEELSEACREIKSQIARLSEQFDIKKRVISQRHYIETIQSQLWENISDAFSDKLKGYGNKVQRDGGMLDPYISKIAEKINELKV